MRNRLEDLGRIYALVEATLNLSLFKMDWVNAVAFSEWSDWFQKQTKEQQMAVLHRIMTSVQMVQDNLEDIFEIAKGMDGLNEQG